MTSNGHPVPGADDSFKSVLNPGVDITKVNSRKLGQMYTRAASAAGYARHDLALCDVRLSAARRVLAQIEARVGLESDEKQQWRVKDACRRNTSWQKADGVVEREHAYFRVLTALVESLDQRVSVLSREMTRRQSDFEQQRVT